MGFLSIRLFVFLHLVLFCASVLAVGGKVFEEIDSESSTENESEDEEESAANATAANQITGLEEVFQKSVQITKDVNLCRLNWGRNLEPGLRLLSYANSLKVGNFEYDLSSKFRRQQCDDVYAWAANDKYKSHVLGASSTFGKGQNGKKSRSSLLEKGFLGQLTGMKKNNQDFIVDWGSFQSTSQTEYSNIHFRPSNSDNGHSETQMMEDINAIFVQNSSKVAQAFGVNNNLDFQEVYAMGLELFGSFDVCDDCLNRLTEFRKQHQEGQQSISQFMRDKIKSRFKGKKEDGFVLIYHAKYPYKQSTYYMEDEINFYNSVKYKYAYNYGKRKDIFEASCFKTSKDRHELFQAPNATSKKDTILGNIHQFARKKAAGKKSLCGEEFIFQ